MENPFVDKFQVLGDHPHPLRSNPPNSPSIDRPLSEISKRPAQVVEKLITPARTIELNKLTTINVYEPDEDEDEDGQVSCSGLCTVW
jgi:hypothetical protein